MTVTDDMLNPLLRELDVMYYEEKVLTADEADDLTKCIVWIIGRSLNESNIQYVVESLRGFKTVIKEQTVSRVIKNFRALCGARMQ